MRLNQILALSTATLALVGCASDPIFQGRNALRDNASFTARAVGSAAPRTEQSGTVTISHTIWLGNQSVDSNTGDAVPPGRPVAIDTGSQATLGDVAASLAQQSGVPVTAIGKADAPIRMTYSGSLTGALRTLSGEGFGWRVVAGSVLLSDSDTQMVLVPRPLLVNPGLGGSLTTVSSGTSNATGSTIGNTPLATADVKSAAHDPVWVAIERLSKELPYPGVTLTAYPLLGLVTLHGPREVTTATRELLERRIRALTERTRVTIRILALDMSRGRNFSTSFTSAFKKVFGMPLTVGFDPTNGFSFSRGQLASGTSPGTTGAINTLATSSSVLDQRRFDMILSPGVVKPVDDTNTIVYVDSISPAEQSSTSTLSTTPTITQKSLTLGLSGFVTAQALTDQQISVEYHIAMSVLTGLNTESSGGYTVQQPSYKTDNLGIVTTMQSGTTVVAEARIIRTVDETGSGVFSPDLPLPGSRNVTFGNVMIVVLLTSSIDHDQPLTLANDAQIANPLSATGEP